MILLIEPSKDLAGVISRALDRQELPVKVAHTSEQAIKLADKTNPKAVVIELLMPRHNGLEFIYEFRSYSDWFDVPIIIYSHLSSDELGMNDMLEREMGVTAHLYKPATSLDVLVSEVKKAVSR